MKIGMELWGVIINPIKLVYDERQAEISRSNCLNFQVPKASAARDLLLHFGQMKPEIGDGFKTWGTPNL